MMAMMRLKKMTGESMGKVTCQTRPRIPAPAVRLLGVLARNPGPLSALREALPQVVNTPELRFLCPEERKFAVIDEVAGRLRARNAIFSDIDGDSAFTTPDGWWLLRASNTQAVLVARAEATDKVGLERLKSALIAELAASGVAAPDLLQWQQGIGGCPRLGHDVLRERKWSDGTRERVDAWSR